MYNYQSASKYWEQRILDNQDSLKSVLSFDESDTVNKSYDIWEKKIIGEVLNDLRDKRVLDVPIGIGRWSQYFLEQGAFVYGVDISEEIINSAKRYLANHNVNRANFFVAPVSQLLFCENSFDYVLCTGLFEHLPKEEYIKATNELIRVTRVGGTLIIVINNKNNKLLNRFEDNPKRKAQQLENGYYCGLTDAECIAEILKKNNINIFKVAANPMYGVLRQVSRDIDNMNIIEKLYENAIVKDIEYYSNLNKLQSDHADEFIIFGIKS